ncbi:MAG: hypothetical protein WC334_02125 [Kiritimatiellales bacterium]|jgi:hypothetical protein
MMKKYFKTGWIVLLAAGLADAGSLTSNFANETAAGKQPLSASLKKTPKPFKPTAPLTMPVSKEKGLAEKQRVTGSHAKFTDLTEQMKTNGNRSAKEPR